jgi:hypothetical protein
MKKTALVAAMIPALLSVASHAEVYQIKEIGNVNTHRQVFATALNNNNQVIGTATGLFNHPYDVTNVDFTNQQYFASLTESQVNALKNGQGDAKSVAALLSYLAAANAASRTAKVADSFPLRLDTNEFYRLRAGNTPQSNYEILRDINDLGWMVGFATAPSSKQSFTPAPTTEVPTPSATTYWVPELPKQTAILVKDGQRLTLPPIDKTFGGVSAATAINNNGVVIGNGSVSISGSDDIAKSCSGATQPVNLCLSLSSTYKVGGLKWQIMPDGSVSPAVALPFIGEKGSNQINTKEEFKSLTYSTEPAAINNKGVIVGQSSFSDDANPYTVCDFYQCIQYVVRNIAVLIENDKAISILDPLTYTSSNAVAINDKDIVVGAAQTRIKGVDAARFFVYDHATKQVTWPTDFFETASTVPRAINNQGKVVGSTQIYVSGLTSRPQVGFIYDIASKTFADLNNYLPCNSGYNIVGAIDINDNNVVIAHALQQVDKRDVKGELVKDANGVVEKEYLNKVVMLTPVANGTVSDCGKKEEQTYQRQGASFGMLGLLSLLGLFGLRRRRMS